MGSIIREIFPDITKFSEVLYATAKIMRELKTKKKKNPHRRKKPIWKEKIEREMQHMQGELSILTELQRGINIKGRACTILKRKYTINKDNIVIIKETVKQKVKGPKVKKI